MAQTETIPAHATQNVAPAGFMVETLYDKCTALARNLWWSWQPEVINLFRDLASIVANALCPSFR